MSIVALKIRGLGPIRDLKIEGLGPVNVFVGRNNSGKSTVLRAIRYFFATKELGLADEVPNANETHIEKAERPEAPIISALFALAADELNLQGRYDDAELQTISRMAYVWTERKIGVSGSILDIGEVLDADMRPIVIGEVEKHQRLVTRLAQDVTVNLKARLLVNAARSIRVVPDGVGEPSYAGQFSALNTHQIFNELWNLQRSDRHRKMESFMEERLDFSRHEFGHIRIDADDTAVVEFHGDNEEIASVVYRDSQGLGEQSMLPAQAIFSGLRGPHPSLILIDEPENHKHPGMQRRFMGRLIEMAKAGTQVFLATHSPVFVARNTTLHSFVLKRGEEDEHVALTVDDHAGKELLRDELGVQNSDVLFSEAVLIVEGETEYELIPRILEILDPDFAELRIWIYNAGGSGSISLKRLRPFFELCGEARLPLMIVADRDRDAAKHRSSILKAYPNLFARKGEDYVLWPGKLVDELSDELLLRAASKYLDVSQSNSKVKQIQKALEGRDTRSKEDVVDDELYKLVSAGLDKRRFAVAIAGELEKADEKTVSALASTAPGVALKTLLEALRERLGLV